MPSPAKTQTAGFLASSNSRNGWKRTAPARWREAAEGLDGEPETTSRCDGAWPVGRIDSGWGASGPQFLDRARAISRRFRECDARRCARLDELDMRAFS